jgi:hypothetical protein
LALQLLDPSNQALDQSIALTKLLLEIFDAWLRRLGPRWCSNQ